MALLSPEKDHRAWNSKFRSVRAKMGHYRPHQRRISRNWCDWLILRLLRYLQINRGSNKNYKAHKENSVRILLLFFLFELPGFYKRLHQKSSLLTPFVVQGQLYLPSLEYLCQYWRLLVDGKVLLLLSATSTNLCWPSETLLKVSILVITKISVKKQRTCRWRVSCESICVEQCFQLYLSLCYTSICCANCGQRSWRFLLVLRLKKSG